MLFAVSNAPKVINLKAIHNANRKMMYRPGAVSNVSKVINLKAIHNLTLIPRFRSGAVSNVSKVINLKAIHNSLLQRHECLFSLQFGEFTLLKFGDSKLLITHRAHQTPPERTAIALRQASPHDILALPRRQSISAVSKYTHKPRAEQIYLLARSVSSRTGGRSLIDARGGAGVQAARLAGTLTSPAKAHLPRPERIKTEPSAIRSHD